MNSQVLIDREFLQELKFLLVQPGTKIDARYLLISGIDRALSTPAPIPDSDHIEPERAMVVPDGWRFSTADFSCIASGRGKTGNVMLVRDPDGCAAWHNMPDALKEDENGPALYIFGRGDSLENAFSDACAKAMLAAAPAPGAK